MNCRFCDAEVKDVFVSLGRSALANSYLTKEDLSKREPFYPLEVYVCRSCLLVQLEEFESPERIFTDYAYFSSYSETWLKHAKFYVNKMIAEFGINTQSYVIEIASNDGYLLQYFIEKGIPVLGIEPARNVAEAAKQKGIPTEVKFFGTETAKQMVGENRYADLLLGNNVLAHVPDLNDFVAGLKLLLKPAGVITMEFPHLLRLIEQVQFDTIYHEHFSYFSFLIVEKVFAAHGLVLFDVEEMPTHGGSLRIYAKHDAAKNPQVTERLSQLKDKEINAGLSRIETYLHFHEKVKEAKRKLLGFLADIKSQGKSIVGYGAAAKGNTLLNYCGINTDYIDYIVDRSPHKQGLFLPGTHIPVYHPDKICQTHPDYVLILPWNLKDEVIVQMAYIRNWGGKFVVTIPEARVIP